MRFFPYSSPYKKTGGLINVFFGWGIFCTSVLLLSYCCTTSVLLYRNRPQTWSIVEWKVWVGGKSLQNEAFLVLVAILE